MRRVCLTLPTDRACAGTIGAVHQEAAWAAANFDVEVHLLVLDSSDPGTFAEHAAAVRAAPTVPNVVVHHLDEAAQRAFLREAIDRAEVLQPDLVLALMLPSRSSYGACTNRAFLIARALGCESVHRRDSDLRYQLLDGVPVHPVRHELASLGRRASEAAAGVDEIDLDPAYAHRPVSMVGASFVGELSVDIGEVERLDPEVYHDLVSLWAPADWSAEQKRDLVAESFRGAGSETFSGDRATLTVVDPMRVDMSNISFHQVQELVPLPPGTETIGSDYFLIHLVHDAGLPGVLHNRHIVNYYTPERRTDAGFAAYHVRLVKFFLSMLYFNDVYARMAAAGESLLDDQDRVRPDLIARFLRQSAELDRGENVQRLRSLDRSYRRLGGRYAAFADLLAVRGPRLLDEARRDIEDFALLTEVWGPLMRAAAVTSLDPRTSPAPGRQLERSRT
ncbi:DUF6271 family protein [Streptacidiphilus carbonis]|uniref:DUF6271 family protein n=1 Tax=Streptacidiphilus carbonis TaxID=105422 RepID=UPI0005A659CA|nr:DUF6271 family protein [Streptacidiphilus carbonis]